MGTADVNLTKAAELTAEAKRRGSDIIVFPELWTTVTTCRMRQPRCGTRQGMFFAPCRLAREQSIYITGSILKRVDDAIYNCAPLFSPCGTMLAITTKFISSD